MTDTTKENPAGSKLDPVDVDQCQTIRSEGSFMSFGPPRRFRCENVPRWIAVEKEPDPKDGEIGAMSLCDRCKEVFIEQNPGLANFFELARSQDPKTTAPPPPAPDKPAVGEPIAVEPGKRGRRVASLKWWGTAEALCYGFARVPAALVVATDQKHAAVVRLYDKEHRRYKWWDAHYVPCREWETPDGRLVEEVDPPLAAHIEGVLQEGGVSSALRGAQWLNQEFVAGRYTFFEDDENDDTE